MEVETIEMNVGEIDNQYLTFLLAGTEEFALPIAHVKEIIRAGKVTNVPLAPSFVRGAINLRGSVVPVLDLESKFEQAISKETMRTCVIVVQVVLDDTPTLVGLMANQVLDVSVIDDDYIEPPKFGTVIRSDFIKGMARTTSESNESFIIVLDVENLLTLTEISALTDAVEMTT